jgi:uncharacterized Fe-S radical SAM superfamily protein PflX
MYNIEIDTLIIRRNLVFCLSPTVFWCSCSLKAHFCYFKHITQFLPARKSESTRVKLGGLSPFPELDV